MNFYGYGGVNNVYNLSRCDMLVLKRFKIAITCLNLVQTRFKLITHNYQCQPVKKHSEILNGLLFR